MDSQFCNKMLKTMQDNNTWFISELDRLTREARQATEELELHRKSMKDREAIMTKLKEITQC